MNEFTGSTDASGLRFAIVVSRYNAKVTEALLEGALSTLRDYGTDDDHIEVVRVPGALEIPQALAWMIERTPHPHALIALGALIRGETGHFEYLSRTITDAIERIAETSGIPTANGVLNCYDDEQALARAGGKVGNKGSEAAAVAVEMARLKSQLL